MRSPEELADAGIVVNPYSFPEDWGPDAAQIYLDRLGKKQVGHPYKLPIPSVKETQHP